MRIFDLVRRYEPFIVAEVPLSVPRADEASSSASVGALAGPAAPAAAAGAAFNALAGYIFGGNSRKEKMAMTMPVFSDSTGRMQFVVRSSGEVCCPHHRTCHPCPADSFMHMAKCIIRALDNI